LFVVVVVVVRHRMLLPVYDADTGVLFLSGKGDGLMRTFELTDSAPFLNPLVEYKARTQPHSIHSTPTPQSSCGWPLLFGGKTSLAC
jgi:hypothetical protein